MQRRIFFIVGSALAVALIALVWATTVWVPTDGGLWSWSAKSGMLRVCDRGIALVPRWSGQRLEPSRLTSTIDTTTSDGAAASVTITFLPSEGDWRLLPAQTPAQGLRNTVEKTVKDRLASLPVACLTQAGTARPECPPNAEIDLQSVVAAILRSPTQTVDVEITPDPSSLRGDLLRSIAGQLPPPNRKVLVLGLDGLDWRQVLPLVQAGRMPNLERLMQSGAWGEMDVITPILSPLIWTTIATGVAPDVHGVLDFVERDPATGQQTPVSGRSRRVPAIWNVASTLDFSAGVIGWWATWPAEKINGTMVSDRLYYTLQQGIPEETFHIDPPDLIYPTSRTAEFTALRDRAVTETDWNALRFFMDIPKEAFDSAVAANLGMEDPIDGMRRILSATRTYMGAGVVLAGEQPDLLMVYLEGTDTIGHLLAPYLPPPTIEIDPPTAAVFAGAVPRYFEIVDRWIGRYLDACPVTDYTVIVVSDHGFKWNDDRPRGLSGTSGPTAPLWHAVDASFVISGKGIAARGRTEERASVYDVTPTVAALLGIPPDPSWGSTLLPGCPPAPDLEPVDWMNLVDPSTYRQSGGDVVPVDPEYINKLRALGYLASDGTSAGEAATSPPEPTAPPQPTAPARAAETVTRGQLNNLAVIKTNQKQYREAEELLRQAISMDPNHPAAYYNLRRIFMETKQYDRADRELWNAVDRGLRDSERTLDRAAADYDTFNLPERSQAILSRAIEQFPDHEPFFVHLMVVKLRTGRCPAALPIGATAAERFPDSGPVHAFYGLAAACAGENDLARREIERSLVINPNQPRLVEALQQLP